jgi:AAA15 family ATPase/GTPase
MLLNIRVTNFRSYNEEQELSLIAPNNSDNQDINATKVGKYWIRKTAVIYGANASGKSNFVKALQTLRNILISGIQLDDRVPTRKFYQPFVTNSSPTKISVDFSLNNDETYTYELSYDANCIHYEALLNDNGKSIFTRNFQNYNVSPEYSNLLFTDEQRADTNILQGIIKQIELTTTKTKTFLQHLVDNNCNKAKRFKLALSNNKFIINSFNRSDHVIAERDVIRTTEMIKENNIPKAEVIELLNNIGNNFLDLQFNMDPKEIKNRAMLSDLITTIYNLDDKEYKLNFLDDESSGTIKFYSMLGKIYWAITNNRALIVDELEDKLHPNLLQNIIRMFNNSQSKAQLIFTTQNPILLSNDLFESDQIYFAEKNDKRSTILYSLGDFTDVKDTDDWINKYLVGKFGAIPYLHDFNFGTATNDNNQE